jgi:hypothetical protein
MLFFMGGITGFEWFWYVVRIRILIFAVLMYVGYIF